ncbi:MAG TPA: CRTAC1 family protein [Candidatus Dormibacteraeota bacterium]|nr:CRTAC1 family protein [Candidatus Dormibacteraeota bacterium]
MNPAGISRRELLKQMGVFSLALATPIPTFNPESRNPIRFLDIAAQAGISFRHDNAASAEKYLIETMGSGCGWIDYDQNGLLDLYLVNGAATRVYAPKEPPRSALYRNNGDGTFSDVTAKAGVGAEGLFGMGAAVGDYDNDGFPDLLVLGYGRCILYHNNGDGTFTDVTARAGVQNAGLWASSAAWFDYDNDGKLDLIIANYVDWSPERNFYCGDRGSGMRSYCHPDDFHGQPPTLYHNNGDGTFTDVSKPSGVASKGGNGLGVVTFDYDNDGWQDIFVANDHMPNFLFHNNRDGTFREVGYVAGVAVSGDGQFEAGMGTDAADTTGDGRLDLIVGHLDMQLARLYQNMGDQTFDDATLRSKLSYSTYHLSTFGTRFMDYDNDGWRDLFMANGHVLDNIERYHADTKYAEPKMMFRNTGRGIFENVSDQLGPDFQLPRVSRGAAIGDFDNDGDLDILINNCGQAAQLLRNDGGNANHWLEIFLIGTKSNRDGVGARVKVTAGDLVLYDQRKGGMSYQSAQDPRLHFGLGQRSSVDSIEIVWPSGSSTKLSNVKPDQVIAVKEGMGMVDRPFPRVAAVTVR